MWNGIIVLSALEPGIRPAFFFILVRNRSNFRDIFNKLSVILASSLMRLFKPCLLIALRPTRSRFAGEAQLESGTIINIVNDKYRRETICQRLENIVQTPSLCPVYRTDVPFRPDIEVQRPPPRSTC
jgi:hypothetical protein